MNHTRRITTRPALRIITSAHPPTARRNEMSHENACIAYLPKPKRRLRNTVALCPDCKKQWVCVSHYEWWSWEPVSTFIPEATP